MCFLFAVGVFVLLVLVLVIAPVWIVLDCCSRGLILLNVNVADLIEIVVSFANLLVLIVVVFVDCLFCN